MIVPSGVSGKELAESALSSQPDLKVIFTNGSSLDAIHATKIMEPIVNLLKKLFRKATLVEKLQRFWERRPNDFLCFKYVHRRFVYNAPDELSGKVDEPLGQMRSTCSM